MIVVLAAIAGGLLLLAVAPDRFVAGAAGLAGRWGVSRVVIGAVVIGFGTSTPEMLVSGLAAAGGEPEVGVGNVIGSNLANLGLIVGVAALIVHVEVPTGLLRRELPLTVAATVLFAVLVQGGLARVEGLLLLGALAVALAVVLAEARASRITSAISARATPATEGTGATGATLVDPGDVELAQEVDGYLADEAAPTAGRMGVDAAAGLIGTLIGAQLLVWGAVEVAERLDLSGGFVGLTIVALGTSLPELVTAVAAARAGEDQLILGNVLGSNLFNCLAVGGLVGVVGPASLDDASLTVGAVALMLVLTGIGGVALARHRAVSRPEALTLLVAYLACLPLLSA